MERQVTVYVAGRFQFDDSLADTYHYPHEGGDRFMICEGHGAGASDSLDRELEMNPLLESISPVEGSRLQTSVSYFAVEDGRLAALEPGEVTPVLSYIGERVSGAQPLSELVRQAEVAALAEGATKVYVVPMQPGEIPLSYGDAMPKNVVAGSSIADIVEYAKDANVTFGVPLIDKTNPTRYKVE